jgi:MraZ protein
VFDRCLSAYPVDEWQRLIEKVNQMPQTSDAVKYFMRRVIGSAIECEIDKQGRILVSAALRADASLDSEVVLLGLGNRIEIWNRNEFEGVADPSKIDKKGFKEEFINLGL